MSCTVLLILNDPPFGTERTHDGLRLAAAVARRDDTDIRVFLMGDASRRDGQPETARQVLPTSTA